MSASAKNSRLHRLPSLVLVALLSPVVPLSPAAWARATEPGDGE